MRRPGYREAIEWLAGNDDCYWLADVQNGALSVSCALVRDLWDVSEGRIKADILQALKRVHPSHEVLR
jgi:hypothetical protein